MSLQLSKYKNIIFDFGGVIINIDYTLSTAAFRQLGLPNFDELFSKAKQSNLFDLYEKGQISSDDFRQQLKHYLSSSISDADLDASWNAMLLNLPTERLELLKRLKTTHRTFLLSNTNEIHIDTIYADLKNNMGIDNFEDYFEKAYLSYKVNMRKPDAEIFELVLNENKLKPEETLFIDDSPQHIETAKKLGIHTHWLDVEKEDILHLLK